jgi:hypothetical protein
MYSFFNYTFTLIVVAAFFHGKKFVLIVRKDGLGYSLGDFFAVSSGHPDQA